MRRSVRGAGCGFLTRLGAVFSKRGGFCEFDATGVGKNGQPPLMVLSGAFAQFEWYRGVLSSSQVRDGDFFALQRNIDFKF